MLWRELAAPFTQANVEIRNAIVFFTNFHKLF
jgi:hypothetical protein